MFSSLLRFLRRFRPRNKRRQTSSPASREAEGVHTPALTLLPKLKTLFAIDAPAIINLALQGASRPILFQSSAAASIPQEIFDLILSEVPKYERKSTLRQLSLVCLAWEVRCRSHWPPDSFSTFTITNHSARVIRQPSDGESLRRILNQYTYTIEIYSENCNASRTDEAYYTGYPSNTPNHECPSVKAQLDELKHCSIPGIRTLSFPSSVFDMYDPPLLNFMRQWAHIVFPRVTILHLGNVLPTFHETIQLARSFPELENLTLSCTYFGLGPAGSTANDLRLPDGLHTLNIQNSSYPSQDVSSFTQWLDMIVPQAKLVTFKISFESPAVISALLRLLARFSNTLQHFEFSYNRYQIG